MIIVEFLFVETRRSKTGNLSFHTFLKDILLKRNGLLHVIAIKREEDQLEFCVTSTKSTVVCGEHFVEADCSG